MKIKEITDLRDYALKSLEKLENGEIDTSEAGVIGKLCESVVSTIKSQMEYAKMLGKQPQIPFMGNHDKNKPLVIEAKVERKMLEKKQNN